MRDTIPGDYNGKLAMALQMIEGDVQAEADNRPLLANPDRAELQTAHDDLQGSLQQRGVSAGQLKDLTDVVQSNDQVLETKMRRGVKFVKLSQADNPGLWETYGISSDETPGQPPEDTVRLKVAEETPDVVTLEIEGGVGATRFEIQKRLEGTPQPQAIIAVSDVKPSSRRWQDFNVQTGTRYIYYATGYNAAGSTGPSNEVLVTP